MERKEVHYGHGSGGWKSLANDVSTWLLDNMVEKELAV